MRFEEFRSLIEERKRLTSGEIDSKAFLRIKEIDSLLCPKKFRKYKNINQVHLYLQIMRIGADGINSYFEIGFENVNYLLELFFANKKNCKIYYDKYHFKENTPLRLRVMIKDNVYRLGDYNDILFCLSETGFHDWDRLLEDNPGLKEFLWDEFKKIKNAEKQNRKSLIKTMINEKDKKLNNSEISFSEKVELKRIKQSLNEVLEDVNQSLEEIEI